MEQRMIEAMKEMNDGPASGKFYAVSFAVSKDKIEFAVKLRYGRNELFKVADTPWDAILAARDHVLMLESRDPN